MSWHIVEGIFYFTSGVGLHVIGRGIYRRVFPKTVVQKIKEKRPTPLLPTSAPYRSNAAPMDILVVSKMEVIDWAWGTYKDDWSNYRHAHACPKCLRYQQRDYKAIAFKICTCTQYLKSHFHFECIECDFRAIMRTADDQEKETSTEAS